MLAGYSFDTLAYLWVGTLLGGIAAGGAGFAFGLAASAVWLHRIDPLHSTILINGCGVLLHLTTIWPQRQHVELPRLWPFVVGGLAGIPIGVYLLAHTNAGALKMTLGVFLILFGVYALIAPKLASFSGGGRPADMGIGFLGGILSGFGGYSGVFPTIWTQLRGWSKERARAVYQPFIIIIQTVALISIVWVTYDRAGLILMILALPPLFLGAWIGWWLYGRLNDRRFRQVLAMLLIASGITLVF
jgi:uncharacterized membrane protein YfcA